MTISGWGLGEWNDMEWGTGVDYPYAPIDITRISITYVPTKAESPVYATAISRQVVYAASVPRNVRHAPAINKPGEFTPVGPKYVTYVPSYSKQASP
jgi:hypothetical protein